MQNEATELILDYYKMKDSNSEDPNYYNNLEKIKYKCFSRFSDFKYKSNIASEIFIILHNLYENSITLSKNNLDQMSDKLDDNYKLLDAILRVIITKETKVNIIREDIEIDSEIIDYLKF